MTYTSWESAKQRCFNVKNPNYKNYGARGITMCQEWSRNFEAFLIDMGERPTPKHSLDRIDNSKGYAPGNCRWATKLEQLNNTRRNTRVTLDGETKTIAEWARERKLSKDTIFYRLRRGRTYAEALTKGRLA